MRHRSLKHLLVLAALLGTCAPELAPAAPPYAANLGEAVGALARQGHPSFLRTTCAAFVGVLITGSFNPSAHGLAGPRNDATNAARIARYGAGFGFPVARQVSGAIVADPTPANNCRGPIEGENHASDPNLYLPRTPELNLPPGYRLSLEDLYDIDMLLDFHLWLESHGSTASSPPAVPASPPVCPACQPVPAPHPLSPPDQRAEELKALGEQHWAEIKPMVIAALVLYRKLHQAGVI